MLSLISYNYNELFAYQIFFAIEYVMVPVIVLWILLDLVFMKNVRKSAIVVSVTFFLFKPFSSVDFLSKNIQLKQYLMLHYTMVLSVLASIILLGIIIKLLKMKLQKMTLLFNIFSICFLLIPIGSICYRQSIRALYSIFLLHHMHYEAEGVKTLSAPDIYYIISDRYANKQTLSDYYQFNNTTFYDALEARGFYVANNSAANYPFTEPSLASSLNMNYFDVNKINKNSDDATPLLNVLENSEVVRYLKSRGYIYYHFGAEWITPKNKNADFLYTYAPKSLAEAETEFNKLNTSVEPSLLTQPLNHGNYMLDQMLELSQVIANPGPKFVFVHSLLTHDPYVFDKNGLFTNNKATNLLKGAEPLYLGQLQFANNILLTIIDTILQSSIKPPVIILQSDEGPYPEAFRNNLKNFNWRKATIPEMREKIRILNAYYLPGQTTNVLYQNISPVNSFRLLLNLYLGEHLPLLPDKSYAQTYQKRYYEYIDVTDIVR